MTCKTCGHFKEQQNERGRCTAHPPAATLVPQQGMGGPSLAVVTYWPEVNANDHCGEWDGVVDTSKVLQS